ncbi:MAG TPA: Ig-like domain-containing protein [Candidatus Nanoarchaeia archaeon]
MMFKIRRFINPPYTIREIFIALSTLIMLLSAPIIVINAEQEKQMRVEAASSCDETYPIDYFHVCYFSGVDPAVGSYLGGEDEAPLGSPVSNRVFAINHDWGAAPVFGGTGDSISGIWRGQLNFEAGTYQLSVFTDDGVRVYLDENLVIDRWDDSAGAYATALTISSGHHNLRVEWYENTGSAKLQFHWDKGPTIGSFTPQEAIIEVFILTSQQFCIAGEPWVSGDRFDIYNSDHTVSTSWRRDESVLTPKILKPSDPSLPTYDLVECFEMGFRPEELTYARQQIDAFADDIERLSNGALLPIVNVHEISGEQILSRWGGTLWLGWWDLEEAVEAYLSKETDFTIAISSVHDLNTGKYHSIPLCGGTYGVDFGLGGAGYTWVPNSTDPGEWFQCLTEGVILNEWAHQFTGVVHALLELDNIYKDGYPTCGEGDADTYKWMPGLYDIPQDPVSPWCGLGHPGSIVGVGNLFLWHYDPSLSHYGLNFFTGNHCDNGKQDFGETGVDTGGNCPEDTQDPTVSITGPSDGSTVSETVNISATASDNFGVTKVEFYVDGELKETDASSPYVYSWDTATVSNGIHSLLAKAYDAVPNTATDTIDVTVSNDTGGPSPPTANIKANGSNGPITITYNTSTVVSWTSTNTTSCSVSPAGWTGVSGSKSTGRLTAKKTYTLNCSGEGGSASDLVTVNVTAKPAVRKLGDLNLDGKINIRDLSILLSKWSTTNAIADLDKSGRVNIRDLSTLLSRWGR